MPSLDAQAPEGSIPHLEKRGQATQLIVDGKPIVMLAGELHNSSSSSLEYMKPVWKQLADMGLNTVLTPTSWELIEPVEGQFDFALVDGLLQQAREQHLHVVFLWLAAWKNGVSGYPPVWVKRDTRRFSRVIEDGNVTSTLSTFSPALREADARAFKALMAHLGQVDGSEHTVLMVQVENEVGVLGAARDHSPAADQAFAQAVPEELMSYLAAHHPSLNPELRSLWEQNAARTKGSWTEIFGDGARADEIFMAWQYGRYVQAVAAAGKAAYPLPMYANAWLGEGNAPPGNYPSGGPQPRVLDIWKAAGNGLDMLSPDLYASDIIDWSTRYHRPDNPLFLPETNGGSTGAANVFYILGEQQALGFSPFGIDSGPRGQIGPENDSFEEGRSDLTNSYTMLKEVTPELTRAQASGDAHGFLLSVAHPSVDFVMHGVIVHVSLDEIFGHHADRGYGLILEEQPDRFLGVGKGFRVSFSPVDSRAPRIGLASVDEGRFEDGVWIAGRRLNGDEDDQGGAWRFDSRQLHIERATLYFYQ
jgi:beta-galactosidase GanA